MAKQPRENPKHMTKIGGQALIEGVHKVQILQGILEKVKPPVTIGGKLS